MDVNVIMDAINNLGFPIIMVGYFVWDKNKTTNELVSVIENNNNILTRLLMKLGEEELAEEVSEPANE